MSILKSIRNLIFPQRDATPEPSDTGPTSISETEKKAQVQEMNDLNKDLDLPTYTGKITHAFDSDSDKVKKLNHCPRCKAETRQQYADCIFATADGPEELFLPAGYFCTACATVIMDQALIKNAIDEEIPYRCVIGVGFDPESGKPGLFKTWNGKETLYIVDKQNQITGMETTKHAPSSTKTHNKAKVSSQKKKLARQSRKKNRKKK